MTYRTYPVQIGGEKIEFTSMTVKMGYARGPYRAATQNHPLPYRITLERPLALGFEPTLAPRMVYDAATVNALSFSGEFDLGGGETVTIESSDSTMTYFGRYSDPDGNGTIERVIIEAREMAVGDKDLPGAYQKSDD